MTVSPAHLLPNPPVLLAPMAGITDRPFRDLVLRFGAGLVVSEMVASQEMVQAKASVRDRAELGLDRQRTAVQLAGRDPYWMAEAARVVADQGAAQIDINMGCPAKKVTSGLSGAALMREPDLAMRLIAAVIGAVDIPVTLKTRLGWDDDSISAPSLAKSAAEEGIQRIVIHGRTRCQFYKGQANWAAVAAVKSAVDVPVIVNGDIKNSETARIALEQSGADGVMIGRGAQGKPWVLAEIAHVLYGAPAPDLPDRTGLAALACEHYEDMLAFYGADLGIRVARKHLGWYLDTANIHDKTLRRAVLTETQPKAVLNALEAALGAAPSAPREVAA